MGKEHGELLVPFGKLTSLDQDRLIACMEGINPLELAYEIELERLRKEGYYLMFFCAPLKATGQKDIRQHALEAIQAASQILGTIWQEKKVCLWIPHFHALPIFNEAKSPQLRDSAVTYNLTLLRDRLFDGLLTFGDRISAGMREEIEVARAIGMDVLSFKSFLQFAENKPTDHEAAIYFKNLKTIFESNFRH